MNGVGEGVVIVSPGKDTSRQEYIYEQCGGQAKDQPIRPGHMPIAEQPLEVTIRFVLIETKPGVLQGCQIASLEVLYQDLFCFRRDIVVAKLPVPEQEFRRQHQYVAQRIDWWKGCAALKLGVRPLTYVGHVRRAATQH